MMDSNAPIPQVLIIDDEKRIREVCRKALERKGIGAHTAGSAEAGQKLITENSYKVVLLDIMLPGMDGLKMLGYIKGNYPDTEVVMITGNATVKDAVDAMKKGAYDFITKPFEIHEIRKAVKKALEKSRLTKEVRELRDIVAIHDFARAVGRLAPIDRLMEITFEQAKKTVRAEEGSISLYDPETNELEIRYVDGKHRPDALGERIKMGDRICGYAARAGKPVMVTGDIDKDERFSGAEVYNGVLSGMSVPMIVKDILVGTLNFRRIDNEEPFSEYDMKLAVIFAQQAAFAIQNSRDYEKLKEVDELKSDFLANVSHELKTPLQSILSACEVLRKRTDNNDILDLLIRNTVRMKKLVFQLLDFSKIEKGDLTLNMVNTDISRLIAESIEEVYYIAQKKDTRIVNSFDFNGTIEADPEAIKRAVINLLDNAVKYSPENSIIKVDGRESDGIIQIDIEDNGRGIPDEEKRNIFDRFYQSKPGRSLTDKHPGIGLGLPMVKQIAELHGGSISVNDRAGRGSVFSLRIPVKN